MREKTKTFLLGSSRKPRCQRQFQTCPNKHWAGDKTSPSQVRVPPTETNRPLQNSKRFRAGSIPRLES